MSTVFTRYLGDTCELGLSLTSPDTGAIFDPTSSTLLFTIKSNPRVADSAALVQKLSSAGGITLAGDASTSGKITVELVPADAALLSPATTYYFDVQAQDTGTGAVKTVASGTIVFGDDVTKLTTISIATTVINPSPDYLSAVAVNAAKVAADADAAAALASQTAAATSATAASGSASAASTSATAAAGSATAASGSASAASASASNAATSATNASTSATAAASSATAASGFASAASTSATNAATSASGASSSASAASTSATNAASSASAASTSATAAATSASSAATSATAASNAIASTFLGGVAGASVPNTATAAGYYYRITSAGTSQGKTWTTGDIAIYNGSSGSWTQIAGNFVDEPRALKGDMSRLTAPTLLSDGATASRTGYVTLGTAGAVAGQAISIPFEFDAPASNPSGSSFAFFLGPINSTINQGSDSGLLAEVDTTGVLRIRENAVTGGTNYRVVDLPNFVSTYGGQHVRGCLVFTVGNSTTTPVLYINGVNVSASLVPSTGGTPPNWVDTGLIPTYFCSGYQLTSNRFIPWSPIIGALSASEVVSWTQTGLLPTWCAYTGNAANAVVNVFTNLASRPLDTFSGATVSGFTGTKTQTSLDAWAGTDSVTAGFLPGHKYVVNFTLTLNSGTAPTIETRNGLSSGQVQTIVQTAAGFNSIAFIATGSASSIDFYWAPGITFDGAVSGFVVYDLGPIASFEIQPGQTVVKDMGTNLLPMTLTSGITAQGQVKEVNDNGSGQKTLAAVGMNQNVVLTPSGTGKTVLNGNTLLGTTTDSSNGRLQLASGTTSAAGIGFGTDTTLYRKAAGEANFEANVSTAPGVQFRVSNLNSGTIKTASIGFMDSVSLRWTLGQDLLLANNLDYSLLRSNGRVFRFQDGAYSSSSYLLDGTPNGIAINATTASTSTTTGALTVGGGLGVAGAVNVGTFLSVNGYSAARTFSLTDDSSLHDFIALNDTRSSYARTWLFGPGTGIAHGIGFRDSTGASNVLGLYDGAATNPYQVAALSTTDATTGGAGALASSGGIYAAKKIISSSAILATSANAAIGFATGNSAGSAVTQTTSRTTGVTINTPTGAITLVSAAGTANYQSFTVTNSAVAATDVPRVVQQSGTDKYIILVTNVAAGSFQVTYATTGGTTTEQPVFNFVIIKGSAN